MNETYEEYMHRRLLESIQDCRIQYSPKEVPTKVTLYADDIPYPVIDLKDIDDMSEEEYNDKLKDAWLKETHYETVEELTLSKYMNYEVEEEKEKPVDKVDWSAVITGVAVHIAFIVLIIGLCWLVGKIIGG